MASKNNFRLLIISVTLFLSGCSTSNFLASTRIPAAIKSQLTVNQPVIAYFSPDATPDNCICTYEKNAYSAVPVENGYFRVLLGRDAEGLFLVQDFYQKNKRPQSSPFWMKDPTTIFNFDSSALIGPGTIYYADGKVLEKFNNIDADTREGESFYRNGQRAMKYAQRKAGAEYEAWYPNGKQAARYTTSVSRQMLKVEAWDEDGNQTQNLDEILNRIDTELDPRRERE